MFNLVLVHSAFPDLTSIKQSSHIEVNQVAISQLALKKKKSELPMELTLLSKYLSVHVAKFKKQNQCNLTCHKISPSQVLVKLHLSGKQTGCCKYICLRNSSFNS